MDLNADTLKKLEGDQPAAYQTYYALEKMARESTGPGKSQERGQLAAFLVAELIAAEPGGQDAAGKEKPPVPRYSLQARGQMAQLLAIVAGDAEVPSLVTAMKDLEIREAARCVLDRIRTDAATDALLAALNEVGPRFRVGVINSLADRGGAKVVKALQPLVEDDDQEVRLAAVDALAKIPDASSDAMIAKLATSTCPVTQEAAAKARVRLAGTLAKSGDKAAARRIYEDLSRSDAAPAQKKAADIAMKQL